MIEYSPSVQETDIQFAVKSYQRLESDLSTELGIQLEREGDEHGLSSRVNQSAKFDVIWRKTLMP